MNFAFLKRHFFAVDAFFKRSLVITFAFPKTDLESLLPAGLAVETHNDFGFLAIALVETKALRPAGLPPFFGHDFFLSGYRIFTKFKKPDGSMLRGLYILRSDTDNRFIMKAGNVFTHYGYEFCKVKSKIESGLIEYNISTLNHRADLNVTVNLNTEITLPPVESPFKTLAEARRFAGPLPHTFGYEKVSQKMVVVKGVRHNWAPKPVSVENIESQFLKNFSIGKHPPILANAFYLENIFYHWESGKIFPITPQSL